MLKHGIVLSSLLLLVFWNPLSATNGFAVTTVSRWTQSGNIPENTFGMQWGIEGLDMPGKILRATIRNDSVASIDTIYKTTYAKFPVINIPGTKIAMYRWEAQLQNGSVLYYNNSRHISVMDMDGSNVRDLVSFPKAGYTDNCMLLDWSRQGGNDWIYYTWPHRKYPDDTVSIWRVRYDDSTTNQHMYTYQSANWLNATRWDISANGARSTLQGYWTNGYTSTGTDFPPVQEVVPAGFGGYYANICCCNIACSPSGLIIGRFIDGGHANVWMSQWDPVDIKKVSRETGVSLSTMSTWAKQNVGSGMGMLRWSTNSDKWFSVMPAGCRDAQCGGNQVLVNTIDKKAIMITHHPNYSTAPTNATVVTFATAGDFWVQGPAGTEGKYEDTLGNWLTIGGSPVADNPGKSSGMAPLARISISNAGMIFHIAACAGPCRIELFSASGRCVFRHFARSIQQIALQRECIPHGIVLARIVFEKTGRTQTFPLSRL